MVKLDHVTIEVADVRAARDWYAGVLGFRIEFDRAEHGVVAMQDDAGVTLFLGQVPGPVRRCGCVLTVQVDDVDAAHTRLTAAGVRFAFAPQRLFWGYGAELDDPDGHRIRLWDETTMREKSG